MINSFPTTQKTQCLHYKERIVLLVKKSRCDSKMDLKEIRWGIVDWYHLAYSVG